MSIFNRWAGISPKVKPNQMKRRVWWKIPAISQFITALATKFIFQFHFHFHELIDVFFQRKLLIQLQTMFGRIRSSSSFDSLDRPPSKILKDDSLSIYEATLMKLKLGSQHHVDPPIKENLEGPETDSDSSLSCAEAMNIEACYDLASFSRRSCELAHSPKEDPMTVDSDFSISSTCASEASGESTENSRQCSIKNYSILYLFSKFKSSPGSQTISEAMTTEDICYVGGMSPSSSTSQSTNNIELHSEQEFVDSLTVLSENVL